MEAAPNAPRLDIDWRDHYAAGLTTPEEVVARVVPGDRIVVVTAHEFPPLLLALAARAGELRDVELRSFGGIWNDPRFQRGEFAPAVRATTSFGTPATREAIHEGVTHFTVYGFGDAYRSIVQRRPGSPLFDQCWFTVTPPNDAGYCCVGANLWELRNSMRCSRLNVAAVNEHLPRTFGDTWIHVSEIDCFIESDYFTAAHEPLPFREREAPSATARAIAQHVAGLVRNGDTLQIGAGSTTGVLARAGAFDDKEELGFFSELTVPGILDLVKKGVITSRRATLHPDRFVVTGLMGTPEDFAYVDGNPFFEFYDYDYVLNPAVICRNDNMVAINNALAVDLRGQIAFVSIGPKIFAGSGGQLAFHTGAYMSRGGRAITVLPSTTTDGAVSRIVHQHPEGQIVTIPWDLADTVVTEHGVADLVGKTMRERAQALIAIAHPDFRPELQKATASLLDH